MVEFIFCWLISKFAHTHRHSQLVTAYLRLCHRQNYWTHQWPARHQVEQVALRAQRTPAAFYIILTTRTFMWSDELLHYLKTNWTCLWCVVRFQLELASNWFLASASVKTVNTSYEIVSSEILFGISFVKPANLSSIQCPSAHRVELCAVLQPPRFSGKHSYRA